MPDEVADSDKGSGSAAGGPGAADHRTNPHQRDQVDGAGRNAGRAESNARAYFDACFADSCGWLHIGVGYEPRINDNGKYDHRSFVPRAFAWPGQADQAVRFILGEATHADVWVCPNLMHRDKTEDGRTGRVKGEAVARMTVHADIDGECDVEKLKAIGGFAVASGSPGHAHAYVQLSESIGCDEHDRLSRALGQYLGNADVAKHSDNDLLRTPGTLNHKSAAAGGEPAPVVWLMEPTGMQVHPRAVAEALGVNLDAAEAKTKTKGQRVLKARVETEKFDLDSYPEVEAAANKHSGDRSADTHRIVGTCFRAGLSLGQMRWAVERRPDLVERLDERTDDDVLRIFIKLADAEQRNKAAAHAENDAEAFDSEVASELHTLRVREEARRRLAAEKEGGTKPFDAGLLEDILARPPELPFRIDGLLPSDSGMLIVAQRKTGKTTFMLNLAYSLLTGQRFLGRFKVRPLAGNVAILNFEVSAPQLARWAEEVGVPRDRLFLVNLRGCRNPLSHPDDRARVAALLQEQQVECVIVDPFARAYAGTNQNDSGEVGAWLTDLDRFVRSEVGALDLILTTHAGWNGERTRGSSALEDWADSVVTMTRGSGKDEDTRYVRAIGRDVHLDEDQLHFDPETRLLSLTGTGSRKDTRKKAKADCLLIPVELYVAEHPGVSTTDLIAGIRQQVKDGELDLSFQDDDVRKAAKLAAEQGLIRRNEGGPGKPIKHYPVKPSIADSNVDGSSEPTAQACKEKAAS